jgi:hypothetical protein
LVDFVTYIRRMCSGFLSLPYSSQLREQECQEGVAASPEGSTSGESSSETGEGSDGSSSSSSSSSSSNDGDNGEPVREREEDSPKVDVTN